MKAEVDVVTSPQDVASSESRLLALEAAAAREPSNPLPLYKVGDLHRKLGEVEVWERFVRAAFRREHTTCEQLYYRARAKLTLGDWSGWKDYEARIHGPYFHSQRSVLAQQLRWSHTAWNAEEDLREQTLLIVHEQGLGDAIQMLRFLPILAVRARRVVTIVKPRLVPFVQHNFGHLVRVEIDGIALSMSFDRYVWSMSLPAMVGYLPPFAAMSAPLRRSGPTGPSRARVCAGICWAGNPDHPRDRERSMSLATLAPILDRPEIDWVSLQVGDREAESDSYQSVSTPREKLVTFADTARVVASLDFVVTVDTAVAHLAGSLGITTYLLLPSAATWRWGLGATTAWYPSMRLLRQRTAGDWGSAVCELIALLDARATDASGGDLKQTNQSEPGPSPTIG
jgi:hypothetical protein